MAQSWLGAAVLHAHGAGGCGVLGDGLCGDGGGDWRVGGLRCGGGLALASLLLWVPLPFYVYSVAYGSVPIFIPQLWPHSYYNSRYGMEMLPALALFACVAAAALERWLRLQRRAKGVRKLGPLVTGGLLAIRLAMIYGSLCSGASRSTSFEQLMLSTVRRWC